MKKSKKDCYIIIIGNLKDRTSDINEDCILGKVVSLIVKHGMKVMWVEDDSQFLFVMKNIIDKNNILKGGNKDGI